MREYLVVLRNSSRYTVRAERIRRTPEYVCFLEGPAPEIGDLDPFDGVVALFEQRQVAVIVACDHLVAEEQRDSDSDLAAFVDDDVDSDSIPF